MLSSQILLFFVSSLLMTVGGELPQEPFWGKKLPACGKEVPPPSLLVKSSSEKEKKSPLDRADKAYEKRTERSVKKARKILEEALKSGYKKGEKRARVYWRLARCMHWFYDQAEKTDTKIKYATRGIEYSKKGLESDSSSGPCHFYYAVTLGLYSRHHKLTSMGRVKKMIKAGKKAARLSPKFENAGAHRLLGRIYLEAPGFLGGDLKKGSYHLQKALFIAPNCAANLYALGRAYQKEGKKKLARIMFRRIIKEKNFVDHPNDLKKFRRQARNRLSQF